MKVISIVVLGIFSCSLQLQAQDYVKVNLSVKVILDSIGGLPPNYSDSKIVDIVEEMNDLMITYHRGIRFVNKEIIHIGGENSIVTNRYFDVNVGVRRDELELDAEANPSLYEWKNNAINIYINGASLGKTVGSCSFSHFIADEILFIRSSDGLHAKVFLHEIGHFFDLRHTHNGSTPDSCNTNPNIWVPGNDLIDDTLEDHSCWNDYDQMAQNSYGRNFDKLTSQNRKDAVIRTFENIMSYHGTSRYELTELQLDKITDMIHEEPTRSDVTTGTSFFVSPSPTCGAFCTGKSKKEFPLVDLALSAISNNGNDMIVLRSGTHEVVSNVISQPVFIKATRQGDAILK